MKETDSCVKAVIGIGVWLGALVVLVGVGGLMSVVGGSDMLASLVFVLMVVCVIQIMFEVGKVLIRVPRGELYY